MVHLLHRLYGVDAPDPDPHILRRIYATVLAYKKCVGANYGGGEAKMLPRPVKIPLAAGQPEHC